MCYSIHHKPYWKFNFNCSRDLHRVRALNGEAVPGFIGPEKYGRDTIHTTTKHTHLFSHKGPFQTPHNPFCIRGNYLLHITRSVNPIPNRNSYISTLHHGLEIRKLQKRTEEDGLSRPIAFRQARKSGEPKKRYPA